MQPAMWTPSKIQDQLPSSQGNLSRVEGWSMVKPMVPSARANDQNILSFLMLRRIELWDTVISQLR